MNITKSNCTDLKTENVQSLETDLYESILSPCLYQDFQD